MTTSAQMSRSRASRSVRKSRPSSTVANHATSCLKSTSPLTDSVAQFNRVPANVSWFAGQTWRPGLVMGQHDVAPWNAVWRDGTLVGFIDWDTAGPSSRTLDLAFAALTWVPLLPWTMVASQGFTAFDDRPRRLHLLLDSYGYDTSGFGANVAARGQMNAAGIQRLANSDPTRRCHHVSVGKRGIRALCAPSIARHPRHRRWRR